MDKITTKHLKRMPAFMQPDVDLVENMNDLRYQTIILIDAAESEGVREDGEEDQEHRWTEGMFRLAHRYQASLPKGDIS
jgi:hypothetical protein